jgi:cysteine desulfurase
VALAAVQHVNHEVGAIQPLEQVHEVARAAEVPLLVDACAALGSVPTTAHWDVLAASAHKWGGPAGVGILAVRTGVRWRSPMPTDEAGRWAGFPDVPGAVAAATALEVATASLGQTSVHRARLLTILRERVPSLAPDVLALGRPDSAPHIICFTVLYADGEVLVTELDRAGFAVSSGSACTADTRRPSHVLAAMGAITHGNLRVSLPPDATEADVAGFLAALPSAITAARASADRASS